jgi:hypothetical protein
MHQNFYGQNMPALQSKQVCNLNEMYVSGYVSG